MRSKTKKILEVLFLGTLFLVFGAIYWLLYTNAGLHWSLGLVNKATHGLLDYGEVHGAWLTGMEFEYLTVRTPPLDIRGENLRLDIGIANLLSGRLDIEDIRASNLLIMSKPTEPEETPEPPQKPGKFALPLGIEIHSLALDKLTYQPQGDAAPVVVENVTGSESSIKRRIDIGSLAARSSYGEWAVSGFITPQKDGAIDLQTTFTIAAMGDLPPLAGSAELRGALNDLALNSRLVQPYSVAIEGQLQSSESGPQWRAHIVAHDVPLHKHFPQIPIGLSDITIKGNGGFTAYSVTGDISMAHQEFGRWQSQWTLEKTPNEWQIHSLQLNYPQTNTIVNVKGSIAAGYAFNASTELALKADWQNLQWPPQGTAVVASNSGELSAQGSFNDYRFQTTSAVTWSGHEVNNIDISAQGTPASLDIQRLSADLLQGKINGSGNLAFGEGLSWRAETELSSIDLSSVVSGLDTRLSSNVSVQGALTDSGFDSTISVAKLHGKLNDRPVAGKAQIVLDGNSVRVKDLALRSGDSRLNGIFNYIPGNSAKAAALEADWDLRLTDLRLLMDSLQGSVTSKGSVSGGSIEQLAGTMTLQASEVQFGAHKVGQAALDAKIDLSEKSASKISLSMQQGQVSGFPLESVRLNAEGRTREHSIDLTVAQNAANGMTFRGTGSWQDSRWDFALRETRLNTEQFGQWRQADPVAVVVATDHFAAEQFCMVSDVKGRLCVSAQSRDYQNWQGKLRIAAIPFAMFKKFLPPQFASVNVDLSGLAELQYSPQTGALLDVRANGENGVISGIKVEGKDTPVKFNHFELAVSNLNQKLEANTSISIQDTGNIDMVFAFPNWSRLSVPTAGEAIQGHVKIQLNKLTVLTVTSPYIKDPAGTWYSDIDIGGTLGAPVLIGESRLRISTLSVSNLGIELRDVDVTAASKADRSLTITGSAKSGDGKIDINGSLNDYRATEPTGTIKFTGSNFQVARIPEATVKVSPNFELTLAQNAIDLNGDITIPEADFKIFTPTKTIAPSPDVVIVSEQKNGQEEEPGALPINVTAKLRVILGKNVKIEGYGLTGRLEGSILINETKELTTASGEIRIVEGKYEAYGTELDIERGALTFTGGAIDNPLIDVRAQRTVENVVAGVRIEGNVQTPKISLFSEPAMDDSNILSYIIIGQPLESANEQQGKVLASAAASIGLLGGDKLAKEIGAQFGIDEVRLQSDSDTQATSLLLGKYLSPDFYVGYAIGIGDAVDTLQIQYKLTEQWVLKTQSGEEQKAEILFTIERD